MLSNRIAWLCGALAAACVPSVVERPPLKASVPATHAEPIRSRSVDLSLADPARSNVEPAAAGGFRSLAVPGFEPAVLFTPRGSELRPLVLATHGAGGDPEWECDYWSKLVHERAFILCLRGKPLRAGAAQYYYPDHHALERELVAAEQAARASEPRIAPGSGVYAGFSQGASMGALILPEHVGSFPYVVLIEGFTAFNLTLARHFREAGGKRIVFACGSAQCASVATSSARYVQAAGAEARPAIARGAGHTPTGAVMDEVAEALPWLFEGDALWQEP